MRAYEFINESIDPFDKESGLEAAKRPLPYTYVIPDLKNQDFYEIYRFALAVAAVRGEGGNDNVKDKKFLEPFKAETTWGEHEVITSFDPNIGSVIDKALKKVHKSGKKLVSTPTSQEPTDVMTVSPVKAFKGYD